MNIYFAGAERPDYAAVLNKHRVKHVAISFYEWQRRHTTDDLYQGKGIDPSAEVVIMSGVARKQDVRWETFVPAYIEFCTANQDRALIFDLDAEFCDSKWRTQARLELAMLKGFVAFPFGPPDPTVLYELAGEHERIGLSARWTKALSVADLRRVQAELYGSNVLDRSVLRSGKFKATTTTAWFSGRRYGELWVFSKGRLRHFSAEQRARAVRIHRQAIVDYHGYPDKIEAGDTGELMKIAIKSLSSYEKSLSGRRRDEVSHTTPETPESKPVSFPANGIDISDVSIAKRERITLPVAELRALSKDQVTRYHVEAADASLRRCDSCYLAEVCPWFKPEFTCAFELPVHFETDADWQTAVQTLLSWQFERVAFGVFAEQVEGHGIVPRVGQEMDRFNKMLKDLRDLKSPFPERPAGVFSAALTRFGLPEAGSAPDATEKATGEENIIDVEEEFADIGFAVEEEGTREEDLA